MSREDKGGEIRPNDRRAGEDRGDCHAAATSGQLESQHRDTGIAGLRVPDGQVRNSVAGLGKSAAA